MLTKRSLAQLVTSRLLTLHTISPWVCFPGQDPPPSLQKLSLGSVRATGSGVVGSCKASPPRTYLEFGYLLSDEEADLVSVIPRVIETAPRRFPIPTSTARLLVVASHRLGNIPMGNKPVWHKKTQYVTGELSAPWRMMLSGEQLTPWWPATGD